MIAHVSYDYGSEQLEGIPVQELAEFVLASASGLPSSTEVSISFVDDETIAELNEAYRGKVGPTDVLSFECDGVDDVNMAFDEQTDEVFELGDVIIATDVAARQTSQYGTTMEEEVSLLLVHGLLHLSGYDHIEDDEAEEMEALEQVILKAWAEQKSTHYDVKFA